MQRKLSVNCFYTKGGLRFMKKALILIPMGVLAGRILYQIVQSHRVTAELAGRYPAMSILGQMKKGRTRYVHTGR